MSSSSSQRKIKSSPSSSDFARSFVASLSADVRQAISPDLLRGVVAYHELLSGKRKKGQILVEVSNPSPQKHGWSESHTSIHIVADDMVFFIDSVTAYFTEKSYLIEHILSPRVYMAPGKNGQMAFFDKAGARQSNVLGQMHMFIQLNRRLTDAQMKVIRDDLIEVISDTSLATRDWKKMKARLNDVRQRVTERTGQSERQQTEYQDFLQYVHDDNFTLLGCREYRVVRKGKAESLDICSGSGLGLFSEDRKEEFLGETDLVKFVHNLAVRKDFSQVFVTKLLRTSPVHRRVATDCIVVRHFDKKGALTGETHFIGLFTSVTYSRGISTVPYLWYKVEQVLQKAAFDFADHNGRALRHILEKYPRDELFQIGKESLFNTCMAILGLQDRPRIALFIRPDAFGRTLSCLVYIPRDRYDSRIKTRFSHILEDETGAQFSGFQSTVDDSPLVRASFTLSYGDRPQRPYDQAQIEARLQEEGRNWGERLNSMLVERLENEDEAAFLAERYAGAFPVSYQEAYKTKQAVHDIEKIEIVCRTKKLDVDFYRPHGSGTNRVSLKLYSAGRAESLSDVLPILENMGLRVDAEYPFEIFPLGASQSVWVQDFEAEIVGAVEGSVNRDSIESIRADFEDCLKGIRDHEIENDSLNRLILLSGMTWRDIVILRACLRYMRQTKIPFSLPYMEQAVTDYPAIARLLVDYFHVRFSPDLTKDLKKSARAASDISEKIELSLQNVSSLDQDKVLRAIFATIQAALRTNFFQTDEDGKPKSLVSIKLDSSKVPNLPDPRPFREIFVYSPRVEGIHLRGGRISRGGLRWSDRHEDFRAEVLSLMKAQQVKNSVIVPMGAKGGFVVKMPPKSSDRAAYQAEGVACYQSFIRGLLDVTDNMRGSKILAPQNVVRHDEDDPYLVVAADKGTATFSDIANAISEEYGFWLGDAFASGGSAGYDHKKMGITARGAWESVKRHFRELNHDTQTQEFEVIGVGDMGGDVFGNGMLQSEKIRLVGAFNHMHIFCDPDPNPAVSFKERARLFDAVKGWGDYDTSKLSAGGRIFLRSEKYLKLTPQICKRFGLEQDTIAPNDLIRVMLGARVDLLFFGGIGTYIKSSAETHADAGDRSNDALRVDAADVRAKVIGEGANLALTQRGRIELARKGGRLNTDFIDNSAGVDTSDHEVNIKILLSEVMRKPAHKMTRAGRDKLLSGMTDDVAHHVLMDNYYQTQALSLLEHQAADLLPEHADFMRSMEKAGLLNRKVEFLPDDEEIVERLRLRKGLTRPELSLIVSYSKLAFTNDLLDSKLPDDPSMMDWVEGYFPETLRKKFKPEIASHQLRREIIATAVSNTIINRLGPTFVRKVTERTGADSADVANAYLIVRDAFGLATLWESIEALDNKAPALTQIKAILKTARLAERETYWILTRLGRKADRIKDGAQFSAAVAELRKNIGRILSPDVLKNMDMRVEEWRSNGLPDKLAREIALLPLIGAAFDLIKISQSLRVDITKAAQVYFALGSLFHFERLRLKAQNMGSDNPDLSGVMRGLVDSFNMIQSDMTARVLSDAGKKPFNGDLVSYWVERCCPRAQSVIALIDDLQANGSVDLAMLVTVDQQLRSL